MLQSLGFCGRLYITRFHDLSDMHEYFTAVTGAGLTPAELLAKGEQNWTLNRMLNLREGFSRKDDRPPAVWFEPIDFGDGNERGLMDYYRTKTFDEAALTGLLDEYYDEWGWDPATTAPSPETLNRLGLEDIDF